MIEECLQARVEKLKELLRAGLLTADLVQSAARIGDEASVVLFPKEELIDFLVLDEVSGLFQGIGPTLSQTFVVRIGDELADVFEGESWVAMPSVMGSSNSLPRRVLESVRTWLRRPNVIAYANKCVQLGEQAERSCPTLRSHLARNAAGHASTANFRAANELPEILQYSAFAAFTVSDEFRIAVGKNRDFSKYAAQCFFKARQLGITEGRLKKVLIGVILGEVGFERGIT